MNTIIKVSFLTSAILLTSCAKDVSIKDIAIVQEAYQIDMTAVRNAGNWRGPEEYELMDDYELFLLMHPEGEAIEAIRLNQQRTAYKSTHPKLYKYTSPEYSATPTELDKLSWPLQ